MEDFIMILRRTKIERNENTIKVLRKVLSEDKSTDAYQLSSKLWDLLDYMTGTKTEEFNDKIEREYKHIEFKGE